LFRFDVAADSTENAVTWIALPDATKAAPGD
jgi:hypothetical protein